MGKGQSRDREQQVSKYGVVREQGGFHKGEHLSGSLKERQEMMLKSCVGINNRPGPMSKKNGIKFTSHL